MTAQGTGPASAATVFVDPVSLLDAPAEQPVRLLEIDGAVHSGAEDAHRAPIVPGAPRLGLADFAGVEGPLTGRLPLPDHASLVARLAAWGIGPQTDVVLYAREPGDLPAAARGWVTLGWAGVARVRFANGRFGADLLPYADRLARWVERSTEGRAVSAGSDVAAFVADPSFVVAYDDVASRDRGTLLIDARGPEAFGDASQHIPGAINLPTARLVEGGVIRDGAEITEAFADALEKPIILSCGSGVAASVEALALAAVGVRAPVYVGSFSEWSKRRSE